MPAVLTESQVVPILHVSQLASLLGLPTPPTGESARLGWDLATTLGGWIERLSGLEWEALNRPTPSRGRTIRNLTVNVFCPVGLLPTAWTRGDFDWNPDDDPAREEPLDTEERLLAYAEGIYSAWAGFLLGAEEDLGERDPLIRTPRGELPYSALLASQRTHAEFHYRELTESA